MPGMMEHDPFFTHRFLPAVGLRVENLDPAIVQITFDAIRSRNEVVRTYTTERYKIRSDQAHTLLGHASIESIGRHFSRLLSRLGTPGLENTIAMAQLVELAVD